MGKAQKLTSLKPAKDGASNSDRLSASELKALHDRLAALRAKDIVLDKLKRKSIQALIAYTAYNRGINEEVIRDLVKERFDFDGLDERRSEAFDAIIRFLADLDIRKNLN